MASEHDYRLLPLRREFTQAWHGFDRNQVLQYVEQLEAQLQQILADRDSTRNQLNTLSRELENARGDVTRLQGRVDELNKPPERPEDLDERMQRTVNLANTRAEEIVARAEEGGAKTWGDSGDVSKTLQQRYRKLLETLDSHAEALEQEHADALAETRAEVTRMTTEATQRRERLDAEAEQKRRALEQEFDATMAAERAALDKHVADQKEASKNAAERRISEATAEAKRLVDEATAKAKSLVDDATADADRRTTEANATVERLTKIRDEARARLRAAEEALHLGESALVAPDGEDTELEEIPASLTESYDAARTTSHSGVRKPDGQAMAQPSRADEGSPADETARTDETTRPTAQNTRNPAADSNGTRPSPKPSPSN